MSIISIAGQLRQGKDVFADYLVQKLNDKQDLQFGQDYSQSCLELKWRKVAFADGLKKVMMNAFGVDLEFIEKWKVSSEFPPDYDMTVRQALQFIGDGFRKIKSSVWVDLALKEDYPNKIISDVRYLNEAQAVKERGGISILLWRPGFENSVNHPSEAQLKPYIDWCSHCGKEGIISDWEMEGWSLHEWNTTPPNITGLFDLFIINDTDLPNLYNKIDNLVLPYLEAKNV